MFLMPQYLKMKGNVKDNQGTKLVVYLQLLINFYTKSLKSMCHDNESLLTTMFVCFCYIPTLSALKENVALNLFMILGCIIFVKQVIIYRNKHAMIIELVNRRIHLLYTYCILYQKQAKSIHDIKGRYDTRLMTGVVFDQ